MSARHFSNSDKGANKRTHRRIWRVLACGACVLALILTAYLVAPTILARWGQGKQEASPEAAEPLQVVDPSLSGWVTGNDGVARYYDPTTHVYYSGWLEEGEATYFIDGDTGMPHTGWLILENGSYWLEDVDGDGRATLQADRWLDLEGERYYLTSDGSLAKGWYEVEGARHFFDEHGRKAYGWVTDERGTTYWVKPEDGLLPSHEWICIDGIYEPFDDDGSWVNDGEIIPPDDEENVRNMTYRQRAVIDACDITPFPGRGLCALWVTNVFANAGEPSVGGDACDMARSWCWSDDLADLKPGMLIAVTSHPRTDNGKIWGHVCIYAGNGMVRDSGKDSTRWVTLGSWFAWYGATEAPKWGWANGIALG